MFDRAAFAVAVVVLCPIVVLAATALIVRGAPVALAPIALPAIGETAMLVLGTVVAAAAIGVATAWLVTQFRFLGRDLFSFALVLPFAVPTYISAYSYVDLLDYFGPVQTGLRSLVGWRSRSEYWFPDVRSMGGAIAVHALVLFPYVYVACRAAFAMQGAQLNDAARLLGASRWEAFRRAVLPAAWPAIAGAAHLSSSRC